MRVINCAEALREATEQLLSSSNDYFVIGEGVPDPKACFGTTAGLKEKFPNRVFDMPISENGGTGICIGASLNGLRPIMIHMRIDFLMYAMDQIINNAAKWYSMFGGQRSVPIVIRAFIGRGWGQGQQHSQNLEAMFAHVPGLKVVTPSNARNAKGLLIASAKDNNPVIMIEHRWVHSITSDVPEIMYETKIGEAQIVKTGTDITIVCWGYMVTEAIHAASLLEQAGIFAEVIDMLTLRPMDMTTIFESVQKTKCLLVVNESWSFGGLAAEILAQVGGDNMGRQTNPDYSAPSSHSLTKYYYPNHIEIAQSAARMCGRAIFFDEAEAKMNAKPHDVPNPEFRGPF